MKKKSLGALKSNAKEVLTREQMKQIQGGVEACGQGWQCTNPAKCCTVAWDGFEIGACVTPGTPDMPCYPG
jgi:hypothetical protein